MVAIESGYEREGGVTYVRVTIENDRRTAQRVRLRSTLDGPVWAPGNDLVGAPEWDDGVWSGTIEPGRIRGLGFASSAAPPDVPGLGPVELVESERVGSGEVTDPREVIASLDGWTPPSSAFSGDR